MLHFLHEAVRDKASGSDRVVVWQDQIAADEIAAEFVGCPITTKEPAARSTTRSPITVVAAINRRISPIGLICWMKTAVDLLDPTA